MTHFKGKLLEDCSLEISQAGFDELFLKIQRYRIEEKLPAIPKERFIRPSVIPGQLIQTTAVVQAHPPSRTEARPQAYQHCLKICEIALV